MKKKLFAIILSFYMILGMAGCGQEISQNDLRQAILNSVDTSKVQDVIDDEVSDAVEDAKDEVLDEVSNTEVEDPAQEEHVRPTVELNPNFDVHDENADVSTFTDAEFGWMKVLDGNVGQYLAMSGELSQYHGQWINMIDICPIEISGEFMADVFYLQYYFNTIPDTEAADTKWSNGEYINVVGYLIQIGGGTSTLQDYALINCRVVDDTVGGDYTLYDAYYDSDDSDISYTDTLDFWSYETEYYNNPFAFATNHKGEELSISGVNIYSISNICVDVWIDESSFEYITCYADTEELLKVNASQLCTVIGTVDVGAMGGDLILKDCVFLQ